MANKERLNEEAALNNNIDSAALQMNKDIRKAHREPKLNLSNEQNKRKL